MINYLASIVLGQPIGYFQQAKDVFIAESRNMKNIQFNSSQ